MQLIEEGKGGMGERSFQRPCSKSITDGTKIKNNNAVTVQTGEKGPEVKIETGSSKLTN